MVLLPESAGKGTVAYNYAHHSISPTGRGSILDSVSSRSLRTQYPMSMIVASGNQMLADVYDAL